MITINDPLKKHNGDKETELDAPGGINIRVNGVTFLVTKGDNGIIVNKHAARGSNDIAIEQTYSNEITIK